MNTDVANIIEMIDRKIKTLIQAKQTLINEFGDNKTEESAPLMQRTRTAPTLPGIDAGKKTTRRDVVVKLLRDEGPLPMKAILQNTGIPRGTLGNIFRDKKSFLSKDDKWHLVEHEKQKEESQA